MLIKTYKLDKLFNIIVINYVHNFYIKFYTYRDMFEKSYEGLSSKFMPYFWMPMWTTVKDPSARFIQHYAAK